MYITSNDKEVILILIVIFIEEKKDNIYIEL
jgi:hypothetical protein